LVGMAQDSHPRNAFGGMKTTAALMLKAPRPGTVKTRLAAGIGADRATEIYRSLVERQLGQIPGSWATAIHFAPDDAESEMRAWLSPSVRNASFVPQSKGDLGARMRAAAIHEFERGADAVALIGGDCPYLTREYLVEAAGLAEGSDVIIGPASDGGYVLLLLRQVHAALFEHIDWSTSRVLTQTIQAADAHGLRYVEMDPLEDIDDYASLCRFESQQDTKFS